MGFFTLAREYIDTSFAPRPITSLVFIALGIIIFISLFGVLYYYGFVFSQADEIKQKLLFSIPNPIWFFYHGVQGIYSMFGSFMSLSYIIGATTTVITWYTLMRILTFTNGSSYSRQKVSLIKAKIDEIRNNSSKEDKTFLSHISNAADIFEFIILVAIYIVFFLIPFLADVILNLLLIIILSSIIFLIVSMWMPLEKDIFIYPAYNFIFNENTTYELIQLKELVLSHDKNFYFSILISLLLSWVSFRQSGIPDFLRAIILVLSISTLVLTSYSYGHIFGKDVLKFWEVKIKQENYQNLENNICLLGCALLSKSRNNVIVLDVNKNQLYNLTSRKMNISFSRKKKLHEFKQ